MVARGCGVVLFPQHGSQMNRDARDASVPFLPHRKDILKMTDFIQVMTTIGSKQDAQKVANAICFASSRSICYTTRYR